MYTRNLILVHVSLVLLRQTCAAGMFVYMMVTQLQCTCLSCLSTTEKNVMEFKCWVIFKRHAMNTYGTYMYVYMYAHKHVHVNAYSTRSCSSCTFVYMTHVQWITCQWNLHVHVHVHCLCVLSAGVIDAKDIVDDEDDSIRHKSILGRPQKQQQAADSDSDNDW